jgi:hypothetical protein
MSTMSTIKDLIVAQQDTATFDAILRGEDWAQYIEEERSRRRNPAMFERIALQKAFIQSLSDEILENLHHVNPRLDWIARSLQNEQQNSDSIA